MPQDRSLAAFPWIVRPRCRRAQRHQLFEQDVVRRGSAAGRPVAERWLAALVTPSVAVAGMLAAALLLIGVERGHAAFASTPSACGMVDCSGNIEIDRYQRASCRRTAWGIACTPIPRPLPRCCHRINGVITCSTNPIWCRAR
jgi:hypothetical protein